MSTLDSFIKQWSKTPASNGIAPNVVPYGWPEGQPPSSVNNVARQQMTDHRYQWEDAEWFCRGETVSKASATTFKIATDVTATYQADRRIKIFDTTTKYATIVSSSYSAPDTTITLDFDTDTSLGASLTAVALGILSATNPSIPGRQIIGKNIIIGGDFGTNPWQRGTTFTGAASINVYSADRFKVKSAGTSAVVDVLKSADAPTALQSGIYSTSCFTIDVTTADAAIAAGDLLANTYFVEGYDIAKLGFGQAGTRYVTLSFWHKHTITGTYTGSVANSAGNRAYTFEYTQDVTDTWERAVITIPVDTTGTWLYTNGIGLRIALCMACGSTFQTAANTWAAGDYYGTSNQVNNLSSASNFSKWALVKLEAGQVATPFEIEDEATVLAKCQRYYQQTFPLGTTPAQNVGITGAYQIISAAAATSFGDSVVYPVRLRIAPVTFTTYNPSNTNANWRDASAGADRVVTVVSSADNLVTLIGANGAAGSQNLIHYSAEAEL